MTLKVYILPSGNIISPFEDPVSESFILGKTLKELQEQVILENKMAPQWIRTLDEVGAGPYFLTFDNVYFSFSVLKNFLLKAKKLGKNAVCGMKKGLFVKRTQPIQELHEIQDGNAVLYNFFYIHEGKPAEINFRDFTPIILEPEEIIFTVELPRHFLKTEHANIPMTSKRIIHINHWVHIYWANFYGIPGLGAELKERRKMHLLWSLIKAHSINKWKIMSKMVKKGKKCDIHPSAIVESVIMGDRVRIGSGASVRGCILGNDVYIEDQAQVNFSVLGDGVIVNKNVVLNYSTLYKEAVAGQPLIQFGVFGKRAITTGGSFLIDLKFEGDIKVEYKGKMVSTGSPFLGCCLGHDVIMGTGMWVSYGREIPNGYFIVKNPEDVLSRIPKNLPKGQPLINDKGTLRPLEFQG